MIGFWILAGLAAIMVTALLAWVMLTHKGNARAAAAFDVEVYRTQLRELDRDVARGVIGEDEAARAKVEISRRLLDADRKLQAGEASAKAPAAATWTAVALSAALIVGGGLWLYADLGAPGYPDMPLQGRIDTANLAHDTRPTQAEAEAKLPAWPGPPPDAPTDYLELVDKLRAAVVDNESDIRGLTLLAQHEGALGNYAAAHDAFGKLLALKGDGATAEEYSQYADLLVLAAQGYVSPEAEEAINQALRRNPRDGVARYYLGLLYTQNGRPDVAFNVWSGLLETSAPNDPWVTPIMANIERLAAEAGVNYTVPQLRAATPGPSAEDIAAAADMTPEERAAMVDDMVTRLMDRLATEGGSADDWARLIKVLMVQGDQARAAAIWGEARQVFAPRPDDLARIDAAAQEAGLSAPTPFTLPEGGPAPAPVQTPAPAQAPAQAPAIAGPTAEDMQAAADLTPEQRQDMVNTMVTGLEDELMSEGGTPERWAQLFKVLGVLDDRDRAKAAWAKAQADFADDAAALAIIRPAAAA
ncbi:MAG TPA: c-type cytochrome biogenesis protein CcmI, partial [Aliiroseovarius sp.]|nr:c-type cytochrome biogenesis protein CcmI [Aliiroseovarius sp.]